MSTIESPVLVLNHDQEGPCLLSAGVILRRLGLLTWCWRLWLRPKSHRRWHAMALLDRGALMDGQTPGLRYGCPFELDEFRLGVALVGSRDSALWHDCSTGRVTSTKRSRYCGEDDGQDERDTTMNTHFRNLTILACTNDANIA